MDGALLSSVRQMLDCCREIQNLLQHDKEYFTENQLDKVNESNQRKAELLDKLNLLAVEVNSKKQLTSLFNDTLQDVNQPLSGTQSELRTLVGELREEISNCYKYVVINSGIVFANLQQLKNIWDRMLACKTDDTCVYDNKGSIK